MADLPSNVSAATEVCPRPAAPWGRPGRGAAALGLVLAAHGLLVTGLMRAWPAPKRAAEPAAAPTIAWLIAPTPMPTPTPVPSANRPAPVLAAPPPIRQATRAAASPTPLPPQPAGLDDPPRGGSSGAEAPSAITQPAAADATASATPGAAAASAPRLLETAATREALRTLARRPLSTEMPGASPARSTAERQAEAMAQAAKGDCNKGEFAGSGMGLLSLPFYLAAQAGGQCAR